MAEPSEKAPTMARIKIKEFKQTELCEECLFVSLCQGVDLPHCNGLDYVKDRGRLKQLEE
jgi:hypothetical protein